MNLDKFFELYPDADCVESKNCKNRYTNYVEGSIHESVWFDDNGNQCDCSD